MRTHHLGNLILGYVSLTEILKYLLELLNVHGAIFVDVIDLKSVLQLYIQSLMS